MQFTFKIWSKIKEAWPIYKENFGTFLLLIVITAVVKIIGSGDNWVLEILSILVGIVLSYIWIRFSLDLLDKKVSNPFSTKAIPTLSQFWDFFKVIVLYSLCVLGGLILLVIPGFYVAGRLVFSPYLSIEKKQGARVTIKEAWEMTKNNGWKLFWKSFVIRLFMFVGFIVFVIGSFITCPLGFIVMAMMYREFMKMRSQNPVAPTPVEIVKEEPKEEKKELLSE